MVDLEATTLKIAPWMAENLCFVSFGLVPCAPFVKYVCIEGVQHKLRLERLKTSFPNDRLRGTIQPGCVLPARQRRRAECRACNINYN